MKQTARISLLAAALLLAPAAAFAACETADGVNAALDAAGTEVTARTDGKMGDGYDRDLLHDVAYSWSADLKTLQSTLASYADENALQLLIKLWHNPALEGKEGQGIIAGWADAWKDMAKQLSAATIAQTESLGGLADADAVLSSAREMHKRHMDSFIRHQPTPEACTFDTLALARAPGAQAASAYAAAFEREISGIGNNERGTAGEAGRLAFTQQRFDDYSKIFCDTLAEGLHAGCTPTAVDEGGNAYMDNYDYKNKDVLVGDYLALDTIPLTTGPSTAPQVDEKRLRALRALIFNLSGYSVLEQVAPGGANSPSGYQAISAGRNYLAKMNATVAPLLAALGDRAPGPEIGPELLALRQANGGGASYSIDSVNRNPSAREMRQAVVEELWNPDYYKNLIDNPASVAQKEVYLRAYNLMLLNELIGRQEKISGVYAVQTSNMLEKAQGRMRRAPQTQGFGSR